MPFAAPKQTSPGGDRQEMNQTGTLFSDLYLRCESCSGSMRHLSGQETCWCLSTHPFLSPVLCSAQGRRCCKHQTCQISAFRCRGQSRQAPVSGVFFFRNSVAALLDSSESVISEYNLRLGEAEHAQLLCSLLWWAVREACPIVQWFPLHVGAVAHGVH